jgi:ATP-binding cassette subfamily B multidrug efflux pump
MNALRRTGPFVRPYRLIAILLVVTTILPVAMELLVPRALRHVIDEGIVPGEMEAVISGSAVMLGAAVAGALATLGQGVFRARLSQGLAYDIRNVLFAHIQTFSFANLDHMQTGQLITRLSSDIDLVRMFVSTGLALLLRALLMVTGSCLLMLTIDRQLTLIMLVLLLLAGLFISALLRRVRPLFTLVQGHLAAINTVVQENLAGMQVVKAFVRERFESDQFQGYNDKYMLENIRVGRLTAVALPALTILTNLGLVAAVWLGGLSTIEGRLSAGELVAFINYLLIGMAPLLLLSNILTMVSQAEASAERVWEILDTQPAIREVGTPHKAGRLRGEVTFSGVSFGYDRAAAQQPSSNSRGDPGPDPATGDHVLSNISFTAAPGQRVALLGATGSGKSTLVNLIPRFYDVTAGQILVDGVDVRGWELETLRRHIGVVLQQTTLFSGTIRENIAYGRPGAKIDEIIAASRAAQAHEFIMALPDGYDSPVVERGANLSGGQKQRIAIARALLIDPAILVLDDSTSAVDLETEAKIQAALDRLIHNRTTFIIAQRISSVMAADQIIILDHGRVAARGTHWQLLESSPIYREIYQSQLGEERSRGEAGQIQNGLDRR